MVELQSIVHVQLVKDSGVVGKPTSAAASAPEQALALLIAALMEPNYNKWLAMHDAAAVRGIERRSAPTTRARSRASRRVPQGHLAPAPCGTPRPATR